MNLFPRKSIFILPFNFTIQYIKKTNLIVKMSITTAADYVLFSFFIPRYTIVAGYYGFTLVVRVSVLLSGHTNGHILFLFLFLHYSLYSVDY